jgi:hypothetical protein
MVKVKRRGAWLTIWLIFMLVMNFFVALIYLGFNELRVSTYPNIPLWTWYLYGLLTLANFVCVIFLFMWKKWPFFVLCGIALAAFVINLAIGSNVLMSLLGLGGPIILYLSMKSRWNLFE